MAWAFLAALVSLWAVFYIVFWFVDRRRWHDIRQVPPDTVWNIPPMPLDVAIPVTISAVPYDWEVAGDFD